MLSNTLSLISVNQFLFVIASLLPPPPTGPRKTVVDIWWLSTTLNEDVQRGLAIDPPTLYRLLSPGIKGKLNLPISQKIPAKPQISLPCAELRPPGRGALVVTAGPVGTVSVGGVWMAQGGLVYYVARPLLWPPASYLLHSRGPVPTVPLIWVPAPSSPLPSRKPPIYIQLAASFFAPAHAKFTWRSVLFKSFVGFDFKTCSTHHTPSVWFLRTSSIYT